MSKKTRRSAGIAGGLQAQEKADQKKEAGA